ncbi:MAG TPA: DNA polymerase I [Candidatus Binataceae bacterium]|nr:DNA polymerase I [Candidatus Binataceae bacterium]
MAAERKDLYLVDGSGYIFRAFFALPQLNNSRGMPTNAAFGFIRMLFKLLKDARPAHIAIIFDTPKKTFRDDLFQDYKANRAEMPGDLAVQIPYIHRAVEAFRIRRIVLDGFEADDVIGTLAVRAAKHKFETTIVTADKDFMQLVAPNITLWDTMRDKRTGVREVRERFGLEPRALVDMMALMGDAIDNVKGVPGVGEKTASALVRHFGSLEPLFENLDQLEAAGIRGAKKLGPLIGEHRAEVELARKLVRIDTDVPIAIEPEDLSWPGVDEQAAAELLRELEFGSLLAELAPSQQSLPLGGGDAAGEQPLAAAELPAALAELKRAPRIAFHLAAAENGGEELLKLAAAGGERSYAIAAGAIGQAAELLAGVSPAKSCHDLKQHIRRLSRYSIVPGGVDFDAMLAGFLVNPGKPEPSITDLYHEYLAPLGAHGPAGSEARVVAALHDALLARLQADGLTTLFREIELPTAMLLAEMEQTGIGIDIEALRSVAAEFGAENERLERECFALAGHQFNLNSPIQLRHVLFDELKLPTKGLSKTKSGYSTDVDTLTQLSAIHELPRKLLEYRTLSKLKSTYADALQSLVDPADGRLHTSFHQAVTATGRLSSSEPNLQNIPTRSEAGRRIRRAFAPRAGAILLSADYSQIELRVLAHLSDDKTLIEAFSRGEDIHVRTACEILRIGTNQVDAEARRLAKVINFGIVYGMGPQRLAGELGIALSEASDYIRRYFERLPGVRAWLDQTLRMAREHGYVTTMYGRRRYLPELNGPQGGARAQAERIAINTPIQGSAADLMKVAMLRVHHALGGAKLEARMVLQVHDELLLEVEQAALEPARRLARNAMEGAAELKIPLRVELKWGSNWAEMATQD